MQQQTGEKENVTYNISNKSNETHNKDLNSLKIEKLQGSPFNIVEDLTNYDPLTDRGAKYFITLANYRITEPTETKDEALDKFVTEHWNILVTVIGIIQDMTERQKQAIL